MATVYRAPVGYEPPVITSEDYRANRWREIETEYIERLAAAARALNGNGNLIGTIYRTPIADGYAQYLVWQTKPLKLIHLELGDAWDAPAALLRGLRLSDIQQQVDFERKWRELAG